MLLWFQMDGKHYPTHVWQVKAYLFSATSRQRPEDSAAWYA